MTVSPKAGQPVDSSMLVNVPRLVTAYYTERPDPASPNSAWRSAPRATAARRSRRLQRAHILAITQAICEYRKQGIDGPLFLGMDTHALSEPASPARWKCWRRTAWRS